MQAATSADLLGPDGQSDPPRRQSPACRRQEGVASGLPPGVVELVLRSDGNARGGCGSTEVHQVLVIQGAHGLVTREII